MIKVNNMNRKGNNKKDNLNKKGPNYIRLMLLIVIGPGEGGGWLLGEK